MTDQPQINSAGDVDPEPQQTDNGPKPGDGEIDVDEVVASLGVNE